MPLTRRAVSALPPRCPLPPAVHGPRVAIGPPRAHHSGAAPVFASRRHVKTVLKQMRARHVVQVKKTEGVFVVRAREEKLPAAYWVQQGEKKQE